VKDFIVKARLLLFSPLSSTDDDEDFLAIVGEYNGRALAVPAVVASTNDRSNSVAVAVKTICVGSTFPTCSEMARTGYRWTYAGRRSRARDRSERRDVVDFRLVERTCWLGRPPICK
jgi:hypothetical protein